ncbi:hypothetical protein HQ590_10600 [bacterium]|nr:hypothetical protein [bacterium]
MTSRERLQAAYTGRLPDQVPFLPTIFTDHACVACDRQFEEALINPGLGVDCMLGAAIRYRADGVRFLLGPPTSWYDEKLVATEDGQLVQRDRRTGRRDGCYDVAGGGKFLADEPTPPLQTMAQVRAIPVPAAAEYQQGGQLRDVARGIKQAHARGLFVVGMCGGQTINFMVEQLGGTEPALLCFLDDPDLALALIEKAVAISLETGRAFVAAGVDGLYIGDSYTSGSVVSPDIYHRFCVPAYREVAQEFHRLGVVCYKHCCGNYNPFLEHLVTVGVDAMDGIDPTSGMSVAHTKAVVGDRLTLQGGISCLTLLQGSPEQVRQEARECLQAGMPGGRYILGSACAVPRFSPPANLLAAREAIDEWGRYAG